MSETDLVGVVLVGGRSTRMGSDKALLRLDAGGAGSTFLERAVDALRLLCAQVVTVGGPHRVIPFAGSADVEPLSHVDHLADAAEGRGPLAGVVAALASGRGGRYLFVSCDAPLVEPGDLEPLARAEGPACFRVEGRLLPLPCALPSSATAIARAQLDGEDRSLRSLLVAVGTVTLAVTSDVAARLRGVNTPDELAALTRER